MSSNSKYDQYIERLNQIRALSSPPIDGIEDADTYSRQLRENFVQIGRLAAENRPFLEEHLYPLIKQDKELTDEEEREISSLEEKLLDAEDAENFDLAISFLLSDKLLQNAMAKEQVLPKLRRIPTGVKHWHGAAPDSWFSHLAVEIPGENGSNEWLEAVSDEQYGKT